MAKPQIFNRDMKRLAYLDNALAVGYGLETNSLWTATLRSRRTTRKTPIVRR